MSDEKTPEKQERRLMLMECKPLRDVHRNVNILKSIKIFTGYVFFIAGNKLLGLSYLRQVKFCLQSKQNGRICRAKKKISMFQTWQRD